MDNPELVKKLENALDAIESMSIPASYQNTQRLMIIFQNILDVRKELMKEPEEDAENGEGNRISV